MIILKWTQAGSPFHHQKNRKTIWKNHQSKAAKRSTVHNPYGQRGAVHLLRSWWWGCSGWFKNVSWQLIWNRSHLFRQLNIQVLYSWREVWVLLGIQYNWALENNRNIFFVRRANLLWSLGNWDEVAPGWRGRRIPHPPLAGPPYDIQYRDHNDEDEDDVCRQYNTS